MISGFTHNLTDYRPLGGKSRRYLDVTTGTTVSRRRYDQLFRLPAQGYRSYEHKAASLGAPQASTLDRFYRVVGRLSRGESLSGATKTEHISSATIWRLNEERGIIGKRYRAGKPGKMAVFAGYSITYAGIATFWTRDLTQHNDVPLDQKNLRLVARYENAEKKTRKTGDEQVLQAFVATPAYDLRGNVYYLLTDLNALYLLHDAQLAEGTDWDALFHSEEGVVYAP